MSTGLEQALQCVIKVSLSNWALAYALQTTWKRPFPSEKHLGAFSSSHGAWTFKRALSYGMQFSEGLPSKVSAVSLFSSLLFLMLCDI